MRDVSRIQRPQNITVPGFENSQEAALPVQNADNTARKSGRKGMLKGTDRKTASLGRNAARHNARRLPTRQMNNRGGR